MAFNESIQDQIVSSSNINSLEKYKFTIDDDGLVRVKTEAKIVGAVEGSFSIGGLSVSGRDIAYTVKSDKWYKLADEIGILTARNSIRMQNQGEVDLITTLNVDPNDLLNAGLNPQEFGIKVFPSSSDFLDITDTITSLWVKSSSGDLVIVIREIA